MSMGITLVFLPYQAAPLMVAYSYRKFALNPWFYYDFPLLLSLIILYPLNLVYWSWADFISPYLIGCSPRSIQPPPNLFRVGIP